MQRIFFSLRFRLILLVLFAVIPALGLILYTDIEERRIAAAQAKEDALRLARLVSSSQSQLIEGARHFLYILAQLPQVRNCEPAPCRSLFANLLKQYPKYLNIGVVGQDGDVFASAVPLARPVNVIDRTWFQRAFQTRAFSIGDYQISRIVGKPSVNFGHPVLNEEGKVRAVVFVSLDLTWLNELSAKVQLPPGSTLTLIDQSGVILSRHPEPEKWVGKNVGTSATSIILSKGEGMTDAVGIDGTPRLYAFTRFGDNATAGNLYLSIGIPTSVVFAKVDRILRRNLAFLGFVALLAFAAAWLGGDLLLVRSLNALVNVTKRLGRGDLSARTGMIPGRGELSQLALAFDDMALSLEQRKFEREQTEEQLNMLFQALKQSPATVMITDTDANIEYVNPKFTQLTGYTLGEVIGKNPRILKSGEIPPEEYKLLWETITSGREWRGEFHNKKKNGEFYWESASISSIKNPEGLVTHYVAVKEDITERKRAEKALRESEEKYRSILENIQDGYSEVDLAGNFTFVNDVVCTRLGYSREELIGMNNRQYTDETTSKKVYQLYNRIYRTGEPVRAVEEEIIRKDGTREIYDLSVSLIRNAEGKPVGFRSLSRDITERKRAEEALRQSEERYRTILESIEDGYYEIDVAGNFTFFNDSMCQIFGYPREELMGMNDRQYTDQETTRKLFLAFNEVYRTGKRSRVFDYEIIKKDGTKKHVEASISLRKDASGQPVGFRGIIRDNTDKKRTEEQLFQAEKLRAVGEMASGVAHDFNNALAAILGNTQLLLYTAQDGELKETLKIIEQVARDSSQTVRRLQEFTRKGVRQKLSKVDINAIVKDSIEITKPKWKDEAQSRGVHIEMISNLEGILFASGNASELREVITNMIFNAIEAMHEGGKIEIRTFGKDRNVFIQISDTGFGITEETKKRIFEPFFTTKPYTNSGLGLSMSYGIVKRFGGEIEVESKVGQGTTFTIILPVGEDENEEAVDSQPIKKGRRARILLIDDDEFVRSVVSRTLAQADHQVILAEDGRKGVQLFKGGEFDIVLTDLGMPGMSGWEVCRTIKEINPRTPVGMITGWGDERNRGKMKEYGLDFFISKPFDLSQILNVVAESMESGRE